MKFSDFVAVDDPLGGRPDTPALGIDEAGADEGDVQPPVAQAAHHVARAAFLQHERHVWTLAAEGAEVIGSTAAEFAAYLRNDIERWGKIVKQTGLKLE